MINSNLSPIATVHPWQTDRQTNRQTNDNHNNNSTATKVRSTKKPAKTQNHPKIHLILAFCSSNKFLKLKTYEFANVYIFT